MIFFYLIMIGIGLPVLVGLITFCVIAVRLFRESRRLEGMNALVWRHPKNTTEGVSILEPAKVDNPPGGVWNYKPSRFLSERSMYWAYEIESDKNGFELREFNPDHFVINNQQTAAQLGQALNQDFLDRIYGRKGRLLQTLALGGMVFLGVASLVGVVFLSVFVQG